MAVNVLTQTTSRRLFSLPGRLRSAALLVLFVACYVLGAAYHVVVWSMQAPAAGFVEAVYHLVLFTGYTALWLLLLNLTQQRAASPAKSIWTPLLGGVLLFALGHFFTRIGAPPELALNGTRDVAAGFDYETGIPLTLFTVVKLNVLGLLEAGFAFFLLARLRSLVLFKRTKSSERNWYLMVGLMAASSLFAFMKPPWEDIGPLQLVPMIPAVIYMVINSFRVSWIVYLSVKEKTLIAFLSLGLIALMVTGLVLLPRAHTYLIYYSYPLSLFSILAICFGILYCTTAFLTLLFHLPTTGDFQRKVDERTAMHSLTALVSQVFDLERLTATITASPVEAGSGDAAWLAISDLQSGSLRPRIVATHHITEARIAELLDTAALYDEVQERRSLLHLEQAPADHRVSARPGDGLGSLLAVPLLARETVLGTLFVTKEVTHGFEQDDVESIRVFAAQAALALDNARLFEEQIEKERLTRELDIAREVQQRLLPQRLPSLDGVTLAASSVSAQEVGGDYYDFSHLDDDRLAMIVADVSGKGTSAAFYMAEMQGIFQSVSHLAPTPIDFLDHANRALSRSLERNTFVSVVYGVLDLAREELTLARAGHCPVATISLGGEARLLRTQGLGLGLDRSDRFRRTLAQELVRLRPGDVFVLYTDGVVESRNQAGDEYGYERLLHALEAHRHEDATELHRALLADLHAFLGHTHYDDDMTLMVLKWHGVGLHVAHAAAHKTTVSPLPF